MIATALQYQVTQDRIRRFSVALERIQSDDALSLRELHARVIQEQIQTLEDAIDTYDRLVSGEIDIIVCDRLADLPKALVEARLVAGLTQRELACASDLPPGRIEQWERDGYSRVPLKILKRIALELPLTMQGETADAPSPISEKAVKNSLRLAGLPTEIFDRVIGTQGTPDFAVADEIDQRLKILFGAGAAQFAAGRKFETLPLRFKLPANASQYRTRAYAAYVEGMCAMVAASQRMRTAQLPSDWREMRKLLFPNNSVSLETAVRQCWSLGIGVLPLRNSVAFHGACRRVEGRATIVVKQRSKHHSRWLFDLVHEVFHIVAEHDDFTLIEAEETSAERRTSVDERRANRFAALILTDGHLEAALEQISRLSGGAVERLSAAVRRTAQDYAVPIGILANLVAENVQASSGRKWWGVAENLQPDEDDPWKIVRDVFIEEADLAALGPIQRELIRNALETIDD